jgi:anti-sigma factor RsiW
MMDYETQLKLQACLDGELAPGEARQWQARAAADPEARALVAELKMITEALAGFEAGVTLPESREFFWSKVQREVERQPAPAPVFARPWVLAGWRAWLAPAGALAAALAAVLLMGRPTPGPQVDTSLADSGAFTYHDFAARTTLVWLSYPADETQRPQPDSLE